MMNGMAAQLRESPFDAMAADYDRQFTHSLIGTLMRRAVWRRLDICFGPGGTILELGCGTGEDAVHLAGRGLRVVATDASPAMAALAREKAERAGLQDKIEAFPMPIEALREDPAMLPVPGDGFHGALSNFGALNCVEDLRVVACGLASLMRPGAIAVLCVMGPHCPWEWLWYLGHGRPAKAFRRLKPGGTVWRDMTIRYPSAAETARAFAPEFRLRRASALGALLPPSYAEAWAKRHPALIAALDRAERRWETFPPLVRLADHYLLELERL
jgi:SAM-dependent methyltransferase